jgi:hypothetical protein
MSEVPPSLVALGMAPESPEWRRRNTILSGLHMATIVSLWIYLR